MTIEMSIKFTWEAIGFVKFDSTGKLVFPRATSHPGLYRFRLNGVRDVREYIGETDTLDRRFQHYRTPGPSQGTNIRLNALMREVLKLGGTIEVSVLTDGASIAMKGEINPPNFRIKSDRVLLEHAAIYAARHDGVLLVNI